MLLNFFRKKKVRLGFFEKCEDFFGAEKRNKKEHLIGCYLGKD